MILFINKLRAEARLKRHLETIERSCIHGKDLCKGPWQGKYLILNLNVNNLSNDRNRITIGDYCNLDANLFCNKEGRIAIGNHVFMNHVSIVSNYQVTVGNNCLFAPNVRVTDANSHPLSCSARERQAKEICRKKVDTYESGGGPVIIEDNVWLCMDVIVLPSVRIGYGSVVGAGSVVVKDIPPMTFASGIPANPIMDIPV
jgi:galactoside O-acetyltransferase